MSSIDRQWGQNRQHRFFEIILEIIRVSLTERLIIMEMDRFSGQGGTQGIFDQFVEDSGLELQFLPAQGQFLAWGMTIIANVLRLFLDLLMKPAHALHDEFVIDHAHDAGKFYPFEKRQGSVLDELEHTPGKRKPAQLAIDVCIIGIDVMNLDIHHALVRCTTSRFRIPVRTPRKRFARQ